MGQGGIGGQVSPEMREILNRPITSTEPATEIAREEGYKIKADERRKNAEIVAKRKFLEGTAEYLAEVDRLVNKIV